MRFIAAAAVVLGCVVAATFAGPHGASNIANTRSHPNHLAVEHKAGGKPGDGATRGNDSCQYANDHECDEPDVGTGACPMNTDYSDCVHIRTREDDSCQWHGDGECDEPNFGSGACTQGTDHTDCGNIAWLRNQNDSCATAFNGVCEEPGHGRAGERAVSRLEGGDAERLSQAGAGACVGAVPFPRCPIGTNRKCRPYGQCQS
jgi:protease YdgD